MVDDITQPPAGSLRPPHRPTIITTPASTRELAAPLERDLALSRWENEGGAVTEAPISPRRIAW